jgi:hypothetical protein
MSSSSTQAVPPGPQALRQWMQRTEVQLGLCVVGVVGSLLIYGVLQVGFRARRTRARAPPQPKKRTAAGVSATWRRARALRARP